MLKSNKVNLIKAVAVGVLFANGSLGMDENQKQGKEVPDRDAHQAKFVYTLRHIVDQGDQLRDRLISVDLRGPSVANVRDSGASNMNFFVNNTLELLDRRTQQRQDLMRQPRTIDLSVKSLDSVRNFLANARIYDVKVKLTLLNVTDTQLNEILNGNNDEIEDLDWTYMTPMPISTLEDPDEETPQTDDGETTRDSDDEDEEDETETPGFTKDGDWENPLDRKGIANPRPRRSVARGRHPVGLRDLVENPGHGVNLVPPNKIVYIASQNPMLDVKLPDEKDNPTLGSWNMTLAKNGGDTKNVSNLAAPKGNQSHHLVNMFCRGQFAMVKAG